MKTQSNKNQQQQQQLLLLALLFTANIKNSLPHLQIIFKEEQNITALQY
jgi:hypothetical protein